MSHCLVWRCAARGPIAAFVARGVCADLLEHTVRVHEPVTSEFVLKEVHRKLGCWRRGPQ